MTHKLTVPQYAVLLAVMVTASFGDALLSRGMGQIGPVDIHNLSLLWSALLNPYIIGGTVLLIGFFAAYMTALSFADLTFVMPATALAYVMTALLSRYWLHEHLSPYRWAGIALIVCAVGFVAGGPSRTDTGDPTSLTLMDSGDGR